VRFLETNRRAEKARLLKAKVDPSDFDAEKLLADTLYRFAGDNELPNYAPSPE